MMLYFILFIYLIMSWNYEYINKYKLKISSLYSYYFLFTINKRNQFFQNPDYHKDSWFFVFLYSRLF